MRNSLNVRGAFKLARFVQEHQIQIIHAHVARDYPVAALAAARAGNIPLVLTRHIQFPLARGHRITLRGVARVIAVSQAVADGLRAQRIFNRDKIVLIHNGIDVESFSQTAERIALPGNRQRVGTIGQLSPAKGQADFIRAAAIVQARRGDVEFIVAGEDKLQSGENRRNLEKLVSQLGLRERVSLLGRSDELAKLLSTFDLFVSPSRLESFGLAIIESKACGIPVVATRTGGASEIIDDGKTGRLVEIGDAPALANAICDLLGDSAERERLSTNARHAVAERFSLERMVDATERLYHEVLAERRGAGRAQAPSSVME